MSADESARSKQELHWYQYRLRTLLIVMTVLAAWLSIASHRARQQKMAVERIRALGGRVDYDYQRITANTDVDDFMPVLAGPPGPEWLRRFVGDDYFQSVVHVELQETSAGDSDVAMLANLPRLEILDLSCTKVTNQGLVHLKGLRKLKVLTLKGVPVDAAGFACLTDVTELRSLAVECREFTDAGLTNLKNLSKLERLWLWGLITDANVHYFASLKNLKMLYIPDAQISDEDRLKLQQSLPNAGIWDWPVNVFPWPARARVTISPDVEKWGRTIPAGDTR
jgi:hypothetical protein